MRILFVDDRPATRRATLRVFRSHEPTKSWACTAVADAESALVALAQQPFDLLVTDWHLGVGATNGIELARAVRAAESPSTLSGARAPIGIMVYSSQDWTEPDEAAALDAGADCVASCPLLHFERLVAQLLALYRRVSGTIAIGELRFGDLEINVFKKTARIGNRSIELTKSQRELLVLLARVSPDLASHDECARALGYPELPLGSHLVQEAMRGLRGVVRPTTARIEAVRGVGYRLLPPPPRTLCMNVRRAKRRARAMARPSSLFRRALAFLPSAPLSCRS